MNKTDYYRISSLTRIETPVRLKVPGGEVTGELIVTKGRRSFVVLRDDGAWVDLPAHAEPSLWRPLKGADWDDPLPEPAILLTPGITTTKTASGRWASMARQHDEADSIKADINAQISPAPVDDPGMARSSGSRAQFWLHEPISYSALGAVSHREAEARVSRAILTDGLRATETPSGFICGTAVALSQFIHSSLTSEDDARVFYEPSGRDHDDYLTAMSWFSALNPPELWHKRREAYSLSQSQKLLVWRALLPPRSWREISDQINRSQEGARRLFGAAIDGVWRAANGRCVLDHVPVKDQLAALRARNRQAMRAAVNNETGDI